MINSSKLEENKADFDILVEVLKSMEKDNATKHIMSERFLNKHSGSFGRL